MRLNEDLVPLDADFPGLIEYEGSDGEGQGGGDGEEEELGGISQGGDKKRKREDSYEDYAKMIDDAPEDDI
ncbi:hypothetical protein C8F04DRAFT_1281345 [Mycena alexandri]|uniref:Uncharacterized protein n=1 Tax=Mycena alexandri TaxID=1745969 RepID=A0AAD6WM94_9AGAR|nr:hypothetical protein C8F04DRAFT_1281345 [Mycena alexandri]